ncbi:MAG: hypothetical protein K0S55_1770, partial [Clostridia bacterium]|nr:hypothetical protein [Clostridia bacterium]
IDITDELLSFIENKPVDKGVLVPSTYLYNVNGTLYVFTMPEHSAKAYDIKKNMIVEDYISAMAENIKKLPENINKKEFKELYYGSFNNDNNYIYAVYDATQLFLYDAEKENSRVIYDTQGDFIIKGKIMQVYKNNDVAFEYYYDLIDKNNKEIVQNSSGVGIFDYDTSQVKLLPGFILSEYKPGVMFENDLLAVYDSTNFYSANGTGYICDLYIINLTADEIAAVIPKDETSTGIMNSKNYIIKTIIAGNNANKINIYDINNFSFPYQLIINQSRIKGYIQVLSISDDGKLLNIWFNAVDSDGNKYHGIYPLNIEESIAFIYKNSNTNTINDNVKDLIKNAVIEIKNPKTSDIPYQNLWYNSTLISIGIIILVKTKNTMQKE